MPASSEGAWRTKNFDSNSNERLHASNRFLANDCRLQHGNGHSARSDTPRKEPRPGKGEQNTNDKASGGYRKHVTHHEADERMGRSAQRRTDSQFCAPLGYRVGNQACEPIAAMISARDPKNPDNISSNRSEATE